MTGNFLDRTTAEVQHHIECSDPFHAHRYDEALAKANVHDRSTSMKMIRCWRKQIPTTVTRPSERPDAGQSKSPKPFRAHRSDQNWSKESFRSAPRPCERPSAGCMDIQNCCASRRRNPRSYHKEVFSVNRKSNASNCQIMQLCSL